MIKIPLPRGISGLKDFPKLREHYVNMMLTEGGPIRTPGITSFTSAPGELFRGAVTWSIDGRRYQVNDTSLLRVDADGSLTDLGTIEGSNDVVFSPGQVELLIIVKGGAGYTYSLIDGLAEITDPDFFPSVDADFIDGRHVLIPEDGEPAAYTNVDDAGVIDGLAFFDAEELPDRNKCVINVRNTLYIGGSDAFETFVTTSDPDVVFSRREGGRVDTGFVAAKVRHMNTFAFLGRERDQGYKIYLMGAGSAQPISSEAINEILNEEYTEDELKACSAESFEHKGHKVLAFTLARHTLCFANGAWFFMDSKVDQQVSPWRAKGITHSFGRYICGDRESGEIGVLEPVTTEYGADIEFEIKTFAKNHRESFFSVSSIMLDCLVAQSTESESISLSLSKDGYKWTQFFARELGKAGNYQKLVKWEPPGGLGFYESFMGIRIRSSANARFSLEALQFK